MGRDSRGIQHTINYKVGLIGQPQTPHENGRSMEAKQSPVKFFGKVPLKVNSIRTLIRFFVVVANAAT